MNPVFDITPEERASQLAFWKRQFFRETKPVLRKEHDLAGQTAIVTGSNTGLGLEASRQLLQLGVSKLIMAVRSVEKGETARQQLIADTSVDAETIEVWRLDIADYESIQHFVNETKSLQRLDIFIHNAGMQSTTFKLNPRTGHEQVMQTNYLSLALLALLLLPVLKEKNPHEKPGRLVLVSSDTAAWSSFKERDSASLLSAFDKEEDFAGPERYWTSKLLGQLFLSELARQVSPSVAIINAPNPGLCYGTSLTSDWTGISGLLLGALTRMTGRSPSVGARAFTDAAVRQGPDSHGQYLEDGKIQPMATLVYSDEGRKLAKKLWDETLEELAFTGLSDVASL